MTEAFIFNFISQKVTKLGYEKYHCRYRDYSIKPNSTLELTAYNELYFIVDDPQGLTIESDYGMYDGTANNTIENSHIHKGEILIKNTNNAVKRIKFIQVILVS